MTHVVCIGDNTCMELKTLGGTRSPKSFVSAPVGGSPPRGYVSRLRYNVTKCFTVHGRSG